MTVTIEEALQIFNAELSAQRTILAALCDWCADAGVIDLASFVATMRAAPWPDDDDRTPVQMAAILDYLVTRGLPAKPTLSVIDGGKDTDTPQG